MWVFRLSDLRFVEVNDSAIEHYGYSREEFLAMTIAEIRPQEDVARLIRHIQTLPREGHATRESLGWRHRLKNGQVIDTEIHSQPIRFQGEAARLVVAIDVSRQMRNERALIESEEHLRLAVESANLGIWDMNLITNELRWSERCRALVQLAPHETVSFETFLVHVHPDDRSFVEREISRALAPGSDGEYRVEYRVVGPRIADCWVAARGRVLRDASGRAVRFLGTAVDVSEQKRTEARLRALTEELTASNAELEQFASSVSHGLREPLRMISAFLQLLDRRYGEGLDRDARDYIGFAASGARRLAQLIASIERVSEIGNGPLTFRECAIAEIVEHVLYGLRDTVTQRAAKIRLEPLPRVRCEPALVGCVFQNLIAALLEPASNMCSRYSTLSSSRRPRQRRSSSWANTVTWRSGSCMSCEHSRAKCRRSRLDNSSTSRTLRSRSAWRRAVMSRRLSKNCGRPDESAAASAASSTKRSRSFWQRKRSSSSSDRYSAASENQARTRGTSSGATRSRKPRPIHSATGLPQVRANAGLSAAIVRSASTTAKISRADSIRRR